jgi:NADH:ubiquinone oxidoreductase subunit E
VLQQAQGLFGYLPAPVIKTISRDLKIPLSEVYGIISFYHFFSTVPKGKYVIQVCMGTSCYVKGGQRILDALKKEWRLEPGGITADSRFSLETVRCLGCCGLSPVMAIGGDVHRKVKSSQINHILDVYR